MAQAKIIDGREVANHLRTQLKGRIQNLKETGTVPGLSVIIVGDDPASKAYVRMKGKACQKLGIREETIELPAETSQEKLLNEIDQLNNNPDVHGILVQMPLPSQIDSSVIIDRVDPSKDVDGFHPENVGKMLIGSSGFLPCTPHGILKMLEYYELETDGKHAVVIGRSNIVGKPVASLLIQKSEQANATVTICHTHTENLAEHTRRADILIVAAGVPNAVTADMIKPHAVVIDVGSNRIEDPSTAKGYRFVGDVDFENAQRVAGYITPVPGGVGPMTITMLLYNTVESAEQAAA